jgi:hypothetical protein
LYEWKMRRCPEGHSDRMGHGSVVDGEKVDQQKPW